MDSIVTGCVDLRVRERSGVTDELMSSTSLSVAGHRVRGGGPNRLLADGSDGGFAKSAEGRCRLIQRC